MKYQRFVSLSAGLSFIIIFFSSGVLYFIPNRKVTAWTDWSFLGLDKQQWDNLHINLGIFFLVMMVWHIYFNWKAIKSYLKVKKKLKIFTKEFNVALAWVTIFTIGTITMTIPLSILVNLGNGIKAINSLEDGNPPFGYAEESSFRDFCILTHIDQEEALGVLKEYNIVVKSKKDTIKEIAIYNDTSPKALYRLIKNPKFQPPLPPEIPIGIAHKSFDQLLHEYQIDIDKLREHLEYYEIKIELKSTFKRVAKEHNLHPAHLYNMVLASQE